MAEDTTAGPVIAVYGQGVVGVEPDDAHLWLRLTRTDRDSAKAMSEVARRSEALQRVLDELAVDPADRSTRNVSVDEEWAHRRQRDVRVGFRASTVVRLRLTDAELIGRLISRATTEAGAEVDRLQWRVSPDNAAHGDACRRAARDARRRAEAYAEGLGVRLGSIERVVESREFRGEAIALGFTRRATAGTEEIVDAHPGEHELTASVDITFRLLED